MDWYGNEDDEKALQRGFSFAGLRLKAKVALEAIRGDLTLAELAAKHGVHHTMIAAWKRQAIDGMASTFSGGGDAARAVSEGEVEKLHAKIGQLVVVQLFASVFERQEPVSVHAFTAQLAVERLDERIVGGLARGTVRISVCGRA